MKTNKRRLLLVFVTTVFTIAAGGVTWWLTSRYYTNKEYLYELHIANFDDPFAEVRATKKDNYVITELFCNGDQRLINFKDGVLRFESYDSRSLISNSELLKLYGQIKSHKLGDFPDKEYSRSITESYMRQKVKYNEIIYISEYKYEINKTSDNLTGPVSLNVCLAKTENNITVLDYRKERYLPQNIYCQSNDDHGNKLLYEFKSNIVSCFPDKDNEFGLEQYLYIMKDDEIRLKKSLKNVQLTVLDKSDQYIIFKYEIGLFLNEKRFFMILNVVDATYEIIPASVCKYHCLSGKTSFLYTDINRDIFEYDFVDKSKKIIGKIPNGYVIKNSFDDENGRRLLLAREGYLSWDDDVYCMYDLSTKITDNLDVAKGAILKVVIGNSFIWCKKDIEAPVEYVSLGNARWSGNMNENTIGKIFCTNIVTKKTTLLDDKAYVNNIAYNGSYLAWTRNAGPKDDQWKNVCYTVLP